MSLILIYLLVMIPTVKAYLGAGLTPAGVSIAVAVLILTVIAFGRELLGHLNGDDAKPVDEAKQEKTVQTNTALSKAWKYVRGLSYAYVVFAVLFVILPSERQMYVMAGAYAVTNIKGIESLPENAVGAANSWLKRLGEAAAADGDTQAVEEISKAARALPAAPVK